ncbi:MAG: NAD(P)/FAD-dependent oxidoreductase [Oligoflexia bacterium]|nr:NAD(P)/FAD-dependent oxidoreductase [Oligoflexia bacterium]
MRFDVIVLGAGAAGMMCAQEAGKRGRQVLVVDHASKAGSKILVSGGGRCNFTNTGATAAQYVSRNPHFCKSALSRFPSERFIELVREHGIPFHEKKLGQLFCDRSAQDIVTMLESLCESAGVSFRLQCQIGQVSAADRFRLETSSGELHCESLVVATGGLSLPKLGATALGHELARQFGLNVVAPAPALDGFVIPELGELAGLSIDCVMSCNGKAFHENILFTHTGLSGPAALQCSLHWNPGDPLTIDLLPDQDVRGWLLSRKKEGSRTLVRNLLSERLPARFAERFCERHFPSQLPLAQISDKALEDLALQLHAWSLAPSGTVGYSKAEVTRGGVDTAELSSKTLEARKVPGLYFVGEVVDVTGWLGGYNFQWAWASGWAAGQSV